MMMAEGEYRQQHNTENGIVATWSFRRAKSSSQSAAQKGACTHASGPLHSRNGKYENSLLTSAFTTDLSRLLPPPIIAFCSGHTLSACDVVLNGIRSVNNMLEYPGERDTGYKPNVCMDYQ
eukprot:5139-Heterococcus_DN1.PRE.1